MKWRSRRDRELDDEIRAHFALAEQDRTARGQSASDAAAEARREFGNELLVKETTRAMWGWLWLERLAQDLRFAWRVLMRSPGFTAAAVLSLAAGIGATTVTFSAADAVLLRPLPVPDPQRLVAVDSASAEAPQAGMSYPDMLDLRDRTSSFENVFGYTLTTLAFAKQPEDVPRMKMGMYVTDGFFEATRVNPTLGRAFRADETAIAGRDPVLALSHSFWISDLAGRADVIGATVRLNGVPFTVVGVLPEDFTVHQNIRPAYYLPITMSGQLAATANSDRLTRRDLRGLNVRARLRPGAGLRQASEQAAALARSLEQAYPKTNRGYTFLVRTELEQRMKEAPALAAVSGVLALLAAAVLAIACANVASLLLARARARTREIAVRLSIGAGRGRIFQQLVTESLVLAGFGAAAGVALAYGAVRYLAAIRIPTDTPIVLDVQLNERVLLAAAVAALISGLVSGAAPAWQTTRPSIAPALKNGETRVRRTRLAGRNVLVVAQVALSVILLMTSAALLEAFRRMLTMDPGIRTSNIVMVEFDPTLARYTPTAALQFYRQLLERVRALPGVRSASLARAIPFRPNFTDEAIVPEGYEMPRDQRSLTIASNVVDPDYFATMGVEIVRGRPFTAADNETSRPVAIVNEEFAKRYWPGQDALSKRFRMGAGQMVEVAGVARTGKYLALSETPQPYIYLPFAQNARTRMTLLANTESDPARHTAAILQVVRSLDPNQPVFNVRDMAAYFEQGVLGMALTAMKMVWTMGAAGLMLAVIGLYGLLSYSVSRRTREIGIRMAIGSSRADVARLILKQGLALAGVGAAIGLAFSVPLFRALAAALSGLGPISYWALAAAPALLLMVSALASWLPAIRAASVNPTSALRFD